MITLQIMCQMWEICRLSRIESFMKDLSQLTLVGWNFKSFLVMVETAKMNGGRKFGEKPTGRKHKLLTSDGILFDKNCQHKLSTSFGMAMEHKYNWTKQVMWRFKKRLKEFFWLFPEIFKPWKWAIGFQCWPQGLGLGGQTEHLLSYHNSS